MEETNKYSNGKPIDIPEDELELEKAIKEWAEGNSYLEEAIRKCIENGIKTNACCAGHGGIDNDPYLAMEINDKEIKKIYSILNSVFQKRNKIRNIDIFNLIDRDGSNRRGLAIHPKSKYKNEIFRLISEGAKNEIEFDNCPPIIQKMMEIEQVANLEEMYFHGISFHNLGPAKAVVILNDTLEINKEIYEKANIKHKINICLSDSKVLRKFSAILEAFGVQPLPCLPNGVEQPKEMHSWNLTKEEKEEYELGIESMNKVEGNNNQYKGDTDKPEENCKD